VVWAALTEVVARTGLLSLLLKIHKSSVKSTAPENILLLVVPGVWTTYALSCRWGSSAFEIDLGDGLLVPVLR